VLDHRGDTDQVNGPHVGARAEDARMWCHTQRTAQCPYDWAFCSKQGLESSPQTPSPNTSNTTSDDGLDDFDLEREEAKLAEKKKQQKEVVEKFKAHQAQAAALKAEGEQQEKKQEKGKRRAAERKTKARFNGPPEVSVRIHNDTSWLPPEHCQCNATQHCDMKAVLKRNGLDTRGDTDRTNEPHVGARGEDARMWCHTQRTAKCPYDWAFCSKQQRGGQIVRKMKNRRRKGKRKRQRKKGKRRQRGSGKGKQRGKGKRDVETSLDDALEDGLQVAHVEVLES